MILTFDCRWRFLKWLKKYLKQDSTDLGQIQLWFNYQTDIYKNALIIEFFDEKGIIINILSQDLQRWFYYEIKTIEKIQSVNLVKTRKEATEQAIKKANEIYNSK